MKPDFDLKELHLILREIIILKNKLLFCDDQKEEYIMCVDIVEKIRECI